MVRCCKSRAYGMAEVVVLPVVQDIVDAVGGENLSCVGCASALAAAAEGVLEAMCYLMVTERGG